MTETRVIRYRTKPECADENARLIAAVFEELAGHGTAGIRYTALRLDDGVTFVHIAALDGDDNPLDSSPAFAAFQSDIGSRLDEGPFPATATVVGSHGGVIGA
jgi:hypothetical protein